MPLSGFTLHTATTSSWNLGRATGPFALVWLFAPNHGFISTGLLRRRLATGVAETRVVFESPEIQIPGQH